MRPPTDVVKRILQTEKGTRVAKLNQYLLQVTPDANKVEIRDAVEQLFNVQVKHVNTQNQHGKWRRLGTHVGRRPDWKKAVVTLAKGQKIEVKG